jgi:hypothetical protein
MIVRNKKQTQKISQVIVEGVSNIAMKSVITQKWIVK